MTEVTPLPEFDESNLSANILRDYTIHGTDFKGLIVRGPFGLLAYIGVPLAHWAADMEELYFPCHQGVSFREVGDGHLRPEGYYWYGWDYCHAGDRISLPKAIEEMLEADGFFDLFPKSNTKAWGIAEVEAELFDAAGSLLSSLKAAQDAYRTISPGTQQGQQAVRGSTIPAPNQDTQTPMTATYVRVTNAQRFTKLYIK